MKVTLNKITKEKNMSEEKMDVLGEMQRKILSLQDEKEKLQKESENLQIKYNMRIKELHEATVKMVYIQELHEDLIDKLVEKL